MPTPLRPSSCMLTPIIQGTPLYEIKWQGYESVKDRTWEPEANLQISPLPLRTAQSNLHLLELALQKS